MVNVGASEDLKGNDRKMSSFLVSALHHFVSAKRNEEKKRNGNKLNKEDNDMKKGKRKKAEGKRKREKSNVIVSQSPSFCRVQTESFADGDKDGLQAVFISLFPSAELLNIGKLASTPSQQTTNFLAHEYPGTTNFHPAFS